MSEPKKTMVNVSFHLNGLLPVEIDAEGNILIQVMPDRIKTQMYTMIVGVAPTPETQDEFVSMIMQALVHYLASTGGAKPDSVQVQSADPAKLN